MYYTEQGEDFITTYFVTFDIEKMSKLRNDIIYNCSFIERITEYRKEEITEFDQKKYRVLKKEKVGDKYKYTYLEFHYPKLVKLIDNFIISKDSASLKAILDKNFKGELDTYENTLKNFIRELAQEDDKLKRNAIERKLSTLIDSTKDNKNQKDPRLYYDEVIKLIKLNPISKVSRISLEREEIRKRII
jgi:hypothetical protein